MAVRSISGKQWTSKLVHLEYEGDNVIAKHEFSKLDYILGLSSPSPNGTSTSSPYGIPSDSPLKSKIIKLYAFVTDLDFKFFQLLFEKLWKHHFLEMVTECGRRFTIEKGRESVILQSCFHPDVVVTSSSSSSYSSTSGHHLHPPVIRQFTL